jgi:hypothetical protein
MNSQAPLYTKDLPETDNYNVIKLPTGFYIYRHVKKDGTVMSIQNNEIL